MAGRVTLKRNCHYCERCQLGFYPLDREMEKRVLDFALNDVYGECAARWRVHNAEPASDNLFRRVVSRVGAHCMAVDQQVLQEELKPAPDALVVEMDGSMLPIRGPEPWKEAKVGVIYRHDAETQKPVPGSARYVAVVNEDALRVERAEEVHTVLWLGAGAVGNWRLAEQLLPDAIQILDWYHALQHAVDCGKVLLGEESPLLPAWQERATQLLAAGEPAALIGELMACVPLVSRRSRKESLEALDNLVRSYRANSTACATRSTAKLATPSPRTPASRPALVGHCALMKASSALESALAPRCTLGAAATSATHAKALVRGADAWPPPQCDLTPKFDPVGASTRSTTGGVVEVVLGEVATPAAAGSCANEPPSRQRLV